MIPSSQPAANTTPNQSIHHQTTSRGSYVEGNRLGNRLVRHCTMMRVCKAYRRPITKVGTIRIPGIRADATILFPSLSLPFAHVPRQIINVTASLAGLLERVVKTPLPFRQANVRHPPCSPEYNQRIPIVQAPAVFPANPCCKTNKLSATKASPPSGASNARRWTMLG